MFRTSSHAALLGLATLAALGLAAAAPQAARAQVLVTGHYDNQTKASNGNGDGYDANGAGTTYLVNNATFDNDANNGFDAEGTATVIAGPNVHVSGEPYGFVGHGNTNITINGGTYDHMSGTNANFAADRQGLAAGVGGFGATDFPTMTINGGDFSYNDQGVNASSNFTLNINGGTFSNDNTGIEIFPSTGAGAVNIYGGVFGAGVVFSGPYDPTTNGMLPGSNENDFFGNEYAGEFNLYGRFIDPNTGLPLAPGTTETLPQGDTFTGQLQDSAAPQTFHYYFQVAGGNLILHESPAPEPSQFAALGIGLLGLAGLAFKARKRSIAA